MEATNIYKKLFEAKKEIGKISKDSTNPFYKSKYFDINSLLEHVEPILQKHGLLLLQPIHENKVFTQIFDIESAEQVNSNIELTNQIDPQKRGSEITYYRRYTLQSLLGLQAEDDDANAASKNVKTPQKKVIKQEVKRLTPAQVKQIPTSVELDSLQTVLKTYDLQPNEKLIVENRINELNK